MIGTDHPRLLIVDDETAQMRALCDTLDQEGYATRGFSSAQQALAALHPGEVDLLLTDLMMPGIDGIGLIKAAKLIDPALGAIVMTGHGTIDTAVQAMQVGALDYILKPFRLNVVLPVIARALDVQRLRHENAALQERERRRTEELAAAYQDLESFSYSISHDLRAPLRAVDGYAQILQDDFGARLGDEGARVIGVIRDGSRKMEQLIVGLLAFSRASRQPLSLSSIDMTAVAREAAAEVTTGYSGPPPRIEIAELPVCAADASVIRQVWCNLIGNALKYSAKQPEPLVRISGAVEEREAAREAVYRVQDNGAGFDMNYAHKLFGVFQRLHTTEEFAGTGVGLAIVHRIVTRHGGRVWAQGAPGEGACFQFALPAASA